MTRQRAIIRRLQGPATDQTSARTEAVATLAALVLAVTAWLAWRHPATAGVLAGVGAFALLQATRWILGNWRYVRILLSASTRFRRARIRVSASYLIRIRSDDDYLLIRGKRFRNQFQPVGGVYKTHARAASFLESLGVELDRFVAPDDVSEHDLRIRVTGRNLGAFLRWFNAGRDRETSPWREFYEELIAPRYLRSDVFPYISYRYISRVHLFRYSDPAQCQELLVADVVELIPTEEQVAELQRLRTTVGGATFRWATENEIRRIGITESDSEALPIADHAEWLLPSAHD